MPDLNSWEVILSGDSSRSILVVDRPAGMRRELDVVELEAKIGSGCRYLRVKPSPADRDNWLSVDAYVSTWSEDIRQAGHSVAAVLGSRVGGIYAPAIADHISRWQQRPNVILFDPRAANIRLLIEAFSQEINSLRSLLSSDEISRAAKIGKQLAGPATWNAAAAAAVMFEDYLSVITAAFERSGLGEPRDNKLTQPFQFYISLISAADKTGRDCDRGQSTIILSTDYSDILDCDFPRDDRRIEPDVRHADLFRSDLVTTLISDLLRPR